MADQKFQFRRIHGRIVPIHQKSGPSSERKSKVATGTALTAAGLGIGGASGSAAAAATKQAARFQFEAKVFTQKAAQALKRTPAAFKKADAATKAGQLAFDFKIKPQKIHPFTKTALKKALKSKGLMSLNKGLKMGGLAVSAGLIGHGLKQVYEGSTGKKADTKHEVITNAAGAASAFAFHSGYAHKVLGGGMNNLAAALKIGLSKGRLK